MKRDSHIKLAGAVFICACMAFAFGAVRQSCAQEIDNCLACHEDQNATKKEANGKVHSLFVDKAAFLRSTHGSYACVDCHEGVEANKHPAGGIPDVKCANTECHPAEMKKYAASKHGQLVAAGNARAPQCYDCHTMHAVLPSKDAASSVNRAHLHTTCGVCHEEQAKAALAPLVLGFVQGEEPEEALTLTAFASSIATRVKGHGKVNLCCEYSTKNCANCHLDLMNHGPVAVQPTVCVNCHGQEKAGIIFGKIHKATIVTNPFLSVLLALGYIAALAGFVFYLRTPCCCKKAQDGGPSAEG